MYKAHEILFKSVEYNRPMRVPKSLTIMNKTAMIVLYICFVKHKCNLYYWTFGVIFLSCGRHTF